MGVLIPFVTSSSGATSAAAASSSPVASSFGAVLATASLAGDGFAGMSKVGALALPAIKTGAIPISDAAGASSPAPSSPRTVETQRGSLPDALTSGIATEATGQPAQGSGLVSCDGTAAGSSAESSNAVETQPADGNSSAASVGAGAIAPATGDCAVAAIFANGINLSLVSTLPAQGAADSGEVKDGLEILDSKGTSASAATPISDRSKVQANKDAKVQLAGTKLPSGTDLAAAVTLPTAPAPDPKPLSVMSVRGSSVGRDIERTASAAVSSNSETNGSSGKAEVLAPPPDGSTTAGPKTDGVVASETLASSGAPGLEASIANLAAGAIVPPTVEAPASSALAAAAGSSRAVGKVANPAPPANDKLVSPADVGQNKTVDAVSGSAATGPHHAGQNADQSAPGSQSNAPQVAAVTAKVPIVGGEAQAQTIVAQGSSHQPATTQHAPESPSAARADAATVARSSAAADSGETAGSSGINAARLIQTMGQTEMRVGMHSVEFGELSIRTSLSQQQMVAQISVDHGDLSQAISAHVSAAQTRLGAEYGLQARIVVDHQGASFSSGSGDSSQQQQRASSTFARSGSTATVVEADSPLSVAAIAPTGSGNRLDIRV